MDDAFADLRDLRRGDRDVRVTVRGDEVTMTIRSPKKFLSVVVAKDDLLRALLEESD